MNYLNGWMHVQVKPLSIYISFNIVNLVFLGMVFPCHTRGACWSAPFTYACDTHDEAYDYVAKYCSDNSGRYSCGLSPYEDTLNNLVLIMGGEVKIVNKTDGTCCDIVCTGKKQSIGGAAYSHICSDLTNPCCGSLDSQCRKLDPTAGSPHGDKTKPGKSSEGKSCEAEIANNNNASVGK